MYLNNIASFQFRSLCMSNDNNAVSKRRTYCSSIFATALVALCFTLPAVAQDSDTSPSSSIDLSEVFELAREYDAQFQAALFELEAIRKGIPLARSAFLPQMNLNAGASITDAKDDGEGSYDELDFTVSLSQTLFNRSSSKALDLAYTGVQQAEAQYASLEQTLILRTATAYFDVLRAQADLEFSQSELEAIDRQREQAERRFDVGLVPITDVRSSQAQFDLAVAAEIAARNQLSTAREALLLISGVNANSLATLADDLPLNPPEPANVDAWVDVAKEQNLELVIAQLAKQSSAIQVDIEKAGRYPTLALTGSAGTSETTQESGRDTEFSQISLDLSIPLLTGGSVSAKVAQARAEDLAANQQLTLQERSTTQQTRDAYRGVQASISSVRALRQALVSTQQSAEAIEAGFRAGTRTSVDVLEALRDTFQAQSDFAGARYDYIINTLSLKAFAGTLNENDLFAINRFLETEDES